MGLGEFEIHFGSDDERRRFEEWWDSHAGQGRWQQHPSGRPFGQGRPNGSSDEVARRGQAPSQGSPTAGMTLEIIEQRLAEAETEVERLEQTIEFHLAEARRLQDHYDWLTAHVAKLTAGRMRMEEEGRAAVGGVEEILGL